MHLRSPRGGSTGGPPAAPPNLGRLAAAACAAAAAATAALFPADAEALELPAVAVTYRIEASLDPDTGPAHPAIGG